MESVELESVELESPECEADNHVKGEDPCL